MVLAAGRYETDTRAALASTLPSARTFYDIGAAGGFFTRFALALMRPGTRVVAIEPFAPSRRDLDVLRPVAEARGIVLDIRPEAIGARDGKAFLAFSESRAPRLSDRGQRTEVRSLDSLLQGEGLPDPDVVKVDVEGAEVAALDGMAALLARARPALTVECHSVPLLHATIGILLEHGYGVRVSRGGDYIGPVIVTTCAPPPNPLKP